MKHVINLEDQIAFSVVHAAEASDTSRTTICRAISNKELDSVKVGGRRLIMRDALIRWLNQSE